MYTHFPPSRSSSIVLYRHTLALVRDMLSNALLSGGLIAISLYLSRPLLALVVVVVAMVISVAQWVIWDVFRIHIHANQITIRRLHFGAVQHTIYERASLDSVACRQSAFGLMCDSGTLLIEQRDRQLRFTLVTPYSLLTKVIG